MKRYFLIQTPQKKHKLFFFQRNQETNKDSTMIHYENNLKNNGLDILFIIMWIAAWNATDMVLNRYIKDQNKLLLLYILAFLASFVALLFINRASY